MSPTCGGTNTPGQKPGFLYEPHLRRPHSPADKRDFLWQATRCAFRPLVPFPHTPPNRRTPKPNTYSPNHHAEAPTPPPGPRLPPTHPSHAAEPKPPHRGRSCPIRATKTAGPKTGARHTCVFYKIQLFWILRTIILFRDWASP